MPLPSSPDDRRAATSPATDPLTRRELEVLTLMATGSPNAAIAGQLGIELATVKSHISNLYRKLGVTNRVEATRYHLDHHVPTRGPAGAPDPPPRAGTAGRTAARVAGERAPATRPGAGAPDQVEAELRRLRDEAEHLRRRLAAFRRDDAGRR